MLSKRKLFNVQCSFSVHSNTPTCPKLSGLMATNIHRVILFAWVILFVGYLYLMGAYTHEFTLWQMTNKKCTSPPSIINTDVSMYLLMASHSFPCPNTSSTQNPKDWGNTFTSLLHPYPRLMSLLYNVHVHVYSHAHRLCRKKGRRVRNTVKKLVWEFWGNEGH